MKPYLQDPDLTLYQGDAIEVLRELPEASVHCVVTSPPYWGLRDYGTEGQLGLEPTPELYIENMVAVFREVRRVLRADGTCWVNLGDSYAQGGGQKATADELQEDADRAKEKQYPTQAFAGYKGWQRASGTAVNGLKPKDLCMIPARVALALQADGWYLRSQIVWSKPNPMPESVTDRPTTSHEFVYLLAKSPRYYFDQEAVREPAEWARWGDQTVRKPQPGKANWIQPKGKNELIAEHAPGSASRRQAGFNERWDASEANGTAPSGRNLRSVWEIATQPYPEAHFATYPEELVRRCILAGTSERGCCPECGAPWVREMEVESSWRSRSENGATRGNLAPEGLVGAGTQRAVHGAGVSHDLDSRRREFKGWNPSCECSNAIIQTPGRAIAHPPHGPIPCIVLDPFAGSGTTGLVARKHGRRSVLIELSVDYCALAAKRLQQLSLLSEAAS